MSCIYKCWLEAVPNNSSRAFCKICNKNLHAHRLTLLKHTASIKHMKRAQTQYKAKQLLEAAKISEPACNLNEPNVIVEVTDDRNELKVECNNINNSDNIKLPTETQTVSLTHGVSSDSSNNSNAVSTVVPPPTVTRPPISTHVLDTSKGLPVPGLPVSLYQLVDGRWTYISEAYTNPDGRCSELISRDEIKPGRFKLHFDTDRYYELRNNDRLFPFIEIVFDIRSPTDHLHIPLLMTPYGYTTYRGS
ncbi:uncharacterized protein LOC142329087 isoform X2 [Lycorma delicatula]|uniref:uncharacterized protein LOC142329087 isoform X2 n=1 Tax=Lycorma delicatula TaxID=130591 RepID=UPI003F51345C